MALFWSGPLSFGFFALLLVVTAMTLGILTLAIARILQRRIVDARFFGLAHRVRGHAEKLDRGENLPAEITISFEDPMELLNILTSERIRLLRRAIAGSLPISDLADGLKRDVRAVSRDVVVLEKAGLLRTSYRTNPGHGRLKIVEALAQGYRLTANL
jgi:predicted transcriptional regulator